MMMMMMMIISETMLKKNGKVWEKFPNRGGGAFPPSYFDCAAKFWRPRKKTVNLTEIPKLGMGGPIFLKDSLPNDDDDDDDNNFAF